MKYKKFLAAAMAAGFLLSAGMMTGGCGSAKQQQGQQQAMKVTTFKPFKSDTPIQREYAGSIMALQEVPVRSKVSGTVMEKYVKGGAPSDLAIIGRYLLTPEIFDILANQEPGAGNEIQLTDAIDTLNKTQRVFAREFKGQRYDVGDKFGFMKTSIDYALKHPQVKDDLKQYIIDLGKKLEASEQTVD